MKDEQPDFLKDSPKSRKEDSWAQEVKPISTSKVAFTTLNKKTQPDKQSKASCAFVIDIKNNPKEEEKNKNLENKDDENAEEGDRIECPYCHRKFIQESYDKHVSICDKVFHEKRNKFDTQKQRLTEIEQIGFVKKENNKKKPTLNGAGTGCIKANVSNAKPQKWNKKSEEFRAILKMNKSHEKGFGVVATNLNQNSKALPIESTKSTHKNSKEPEEDFLIPALKHSNQPQSIRSETFIECNLCKKKYTEFKYKDHRGDCENKFKDLENKNKNKGMLLGQPHLFGSSSPKGICVPDISAQLGGKGVYQRDQIVHSSGFNSKPNSNWGSKPVLNLKFGKR